MDWGRYELGCLTGELGLVWISICNFCLILRVVVRKQKSITRESYKKRGKKKKLFTPNDFQSPKLDDLMSTRRTLSVIYMDLFKCQQSTGIKCNLLIVFIWLTTGFFYYYLFIYLIFWWHFMNVKTYYFWVIFMISKILSRGKKGSKCVVLPLKDMRFCSLGVICIV